MIKWVKMGKRVDAEGTTISYWGTGTPYIIESRLRHIEHAGGRGGTWDHTTYWVIRDGTDVKEFWQLKIAKEWCEKATKEV